VIKFATYFSEDRKVDMPQNPETSPETTTTCADRCGSSPKPELICVGLTISAMMLIAGAASYVSSRENHDGNETELPAISYMFFAVGALFPIVIAGKMLRDAISNRGQETYQQPMEEISPNEMGDPSRSRTAVDIENMPPSIFTMPARDTRELGDSHEAVEENNPESRPSTPSIR
jgi:hypothetical protein